jgi:hypothetical protein
MAGGGGIAFSANARLEVVSSGLGRRKFSRFDAGTMESVVDIMEVNLQKGLNEFLDFLEDLWIHTVRAAATVRPPASPATLFAERTGNQWAKRLNVGWENYPSGTDGAIRRFEPIKARWMAAAERAFKHAFDASILTSGYSGNMARVRGEAFAEVSSMRTGTGAKAEKVSRAGHKFKRGI